VLTHVDALDRGTRAAQHRVGELRDGRIARLAEYFDTRPLVP
jgi:ketosteroid isomerase-like protein